MRGPFYFYLFIFFPFLFSKLLQFVLDLPNWKFPTGKKHFTPGKNQAKWLCPLRKMFLYTPLPECVSLPARAYLISSRHLYSFNRKLGILQGTTAVITSSILSNSFIISIINPVYIHLTFCATICVENPGQNYYRMLLVLPAHLLNSHLFQVDGDRRSQS